MKSPYLLDIHRGKVVDLQTVLRKIPETSSYHVTAASTRTSPHYSSHFKFSTVLKQRPNLRIQNAFLLPDANSTIETKNYKINRTEHLQARVSLSLSQKIAHSPTFQNPSPPPTAFQKHTLKISRNSKLPSNTQSTKT